MKQTNKKFCLFAKSKAGHSKRLLCETRQIRRNVETSSIRCSTETAIKYVNLVNIKKHLICRCHSYKKKAVVISIVWCFESHCVLMQIFRSFPLSLSADFERQVNLISNKQRRLHALMRCVFTQVVCFRC